jgi:hypothetical protein
MSTSPEFSSASGGSVASDDIRINPVLVRKKGPNAAHKSTAVVAIAHGSTLRKKPKHLSTVFCAHFAVLLLLCPDHERLGGFTSANPESKVE